MERGGDDIITGGTGTNFLTGGTSNDTITANGVDTITGQADANFTLTNTELLVGGESGTYIGSIELVNSTGGDGNNGLNASALTGTVMLDRAAEDSALTGAARRYCSTGGPSK